VLDFLKTRKPMNCACCNGLVGFIQQPTGKLVCVNPKCQGVNGAPAQAYLIKKRFVRRFYFYELRFMEVLCGNASCVIIDFMCNYVALIVMPVIRSR
jgi:hypothetical protein